MTISEIIYTIKFQKREKQKAYKKIMFESPDGIDKENSLLALKTAIDTYVYVLSLLENSHPVKQAKAMDILKEYITVQKGKIVGLYRDGEDIYIISAKDRRTQMEITKENYDLLNEVLNGKNN